MNPKPLPSAPPPLITLADVYYILFRHKWMITILLILGVVAASVVYAIRPVTYASSASLLIRYVLDAKSPLQTADIAKVAETDQGGAGIINTEMQILRSYDLAVAVATNMGPEKILDLPSATNDVDAAARVIQGGLLMDHSGDVILLGFESPHRALVQPILVKIIDTYRKMHIEIHRPVGEYDDALTEQSETLKSEINELEREIRDKKNEAKVISLEDSKSAYEGQLGRIQESILSAETDLAEHEAVIGHLTNQLHSLGATFGATNNTPQPHETPVPAEKITQYRRLVSHLNRLEQRENDLLETYTPQNSAVQAVEKQIDSAETERTKLETNYPSLVAIKTQGTGPDPTAPLVAELGSESTRVIGLLSRIGSLRLEYSNIWNTATNLETDEIPILELQQKLGLKQRAYNNLVANLDESKNEQAFGPNRVSNIQAIEEPTPAALKLTKVIKEVMGIVLGSLGLGIALAFAIELFLDRSLKHPREVENLLKFPFFLSIPRLKEDRKSERLAAAKKTRLLKEGTEADKSLTTVPNGAATFNGHGLSFDVKENMQPFFETLRDRMITYFEMINLTHKPKLVAVTSCGQGAGVTTIASGLAAALSETGDGNVLLVDMNEQEGEAHHFYKGKLACGLDEVLEKTTRDGAMIMDNLYLAREGGNSDLPRILPKRFTSLVQKMKASDYDYIIFDMPPISQISTTPRLARFMDMVLMVVESGKTDRDAAKRAATLLSDSKTNVGLVLNKRRRYVPRRLEHDI